MMILPESLPERLYPLAWILGSWRGWGFAPGRGEGEADRPILLSLDITAEGEKVSYSLLARWAESNGALDITADAHAGMSVLAPSGEAWREEGSWELTASQAATATSETLGEGVMTLTGGRFGGSTTWAFRAQGPRIGARTATIEGATEGGERLLEATRMYGLVGGELMWAEDAARNGEEPCPAATGRLARADQ